MILIHIKAMYCCYSFVLNIRGVGLFEIRTTRPKYSTRRTRAESDPLLEVPNYSNFNRIVRNDTTVRHNQTVRSDRTV